MGAGCGKGGGGGDGIGGVAPSTRDLHQIIQELKNQTGLSFNPDSFQNWGGTQVM